MEPFRFHMLRLALDMLIGDRARYLGIVGGIAAAAFLIAQQLALLNGVLDRISSTIRNLGNAEVWVMDPGVQYADDARPMADAQLMRVRSVDGVGWAVPLYKSNVQIRIEDGSLQTAVLNGLDDATLFGGPSEMVAGTLAGLRESDAVIVDAVAAATKLASRGTDGQKRPLRLGSVLEINDRRAVVVGLCKVAGTFQSSPVLYTTWSRAGRFASRERKRLSFVLVKAAQGIDPAELALRIGRATGLAAHTNEQFRRMTEAYFVRETGIVATMGFGIAVSFFVGTAIAGQTFFNFMLGNLRQFGAVKAMGATNALLLGMIGVQALLAGSIGLGLGLGAASLVAVAAQGTELSMRFSGMQVAATAGSVLAITLLAAWFGARRVLRLDPAIVFKG